MVVLAAVVKRWIRQSPISQKTLAAAAAGRPFQLKAVLCVTALAFATGESCLGGLGTSMFQGLALGTGALKSALPSGPSAWISTHIGMLSSWGTTNEKSPSKSRSVMNGPMCTYEPFRVQPLGKLKLPVIVLTVGRLNATFVSAEPFTLPWMLPSAIVMGRRPKPVYSLTPTWLLKTY